MGRERLTVASILVVTLVMLISIFLPYYTGLWLYGGVIHSILGLWVTGAASVILVVTFGAFLYGIFQGVVAILKGG